MALYPSSNLYPRDTLYPNQTLIKIYSPVKYKTDIELSEFFTNLDILDESSIVEFLVSSGDLQYNSVDTFIMTNNSPTSLVDIDYSDSSTTISGVSSLIEVNEFISTTELMSESNLVNQSSVDSEIEIRSNRTTVSIKEI